MARPRTTKAPATTGTRKRQTAPPAAEPSPDSPEPAEETTDAENGSESAEDFIEAEAVEEEDVSKIELPPEAETALAVIEREQARPPAVQHSLPSPLEWAGMRALAAEIATTEFVPSSFRGRPEAVLACIMAGREMGIGSMQALRQIHIIDGRPAFAADLMMGKMREGGVVVLESSATAERAFIRARRRDTGEECEVEWTAAEAKTAGLDSKKNWKTYPADMLWARVVGRLARRLGSDLLGGNVYSAEEVRDMQDDDLGSDYDSPGAYAPDRSAYFDPGKDLLPGSIPLDKEFFKRVGENMQALDSEVNWTYVLNQCAMSVWPQVKAWKELEGDDYRAFCTRLTNALTKVVELGKGVEFVTTEALVEGFAFAFDGYEPDFARGAVAAEEPKESEPKGSVDPDDIPFTEEADADADPESDR